MAIATETVAQRCENIVTGVALNINFPAFEVGDVTVYYGKASLVAVYNVDYTVTLDTVNFNTFTVTPLASLLTKINNLIAADPTETNFIVVRRIMNFLTVTSPGSVRDLNFLSRELDRTALRFAQLSEEVKRSVRASPRFINQNLIIDDLVQNATLLYKNGKIGVGPTADQVAGAQASANTATTKATEASASATAAAASAASAALYDGPWLDTVAALLADTALTYTAGQPGTVVTGDIVRTRAEGFAYRVAAVGASNPHIVTAGGVVLHVMPVNGAYYPLAAWGLVNDGVTDNFDKFRSAANACRLNNIGGLCMPSGRYYLRAEFVVDWQGSFYGTGGLNWANDNACTNLYFPAGTNGVRVPRGNTSPSGKLGDWSRLFGFAVKCTGDNRNSTGHGIVLDARAHVTDVWASDFPEDGFNVVATAPEKNANSFVLFNCRATGNGRDGFFFAGADANSGTIIGCDASYNGRVNFYDKSFLGNGFFGCHSDAPGKRAYAKGSDGQAYRCKLDHVATADTLPVTGVNWTTYWELWSPTTSYSVAGIGTKYYDSRAGNVAASGIYHYMSDNANSTTVLNSCYAEGTSFGQGSNFLSNDRKTIIGGTGMSVVDYPNTRGQRIGGPLKAVVYADNAAPTATNRIEATLGGMDGRFGALTFGVSESNFSGSVWGLVWDSTNKRWYFGSSADASRCFYLMENGNTHSLPGGVLDFSPQGFALGGKRHFFGTAAPATGTWAQGDIIFATNPAAGGRAGWVCTTGGTAGSTAVFKPFGAIDV